VGTGGLSHQLTGPRFGQVTPDWDKEFMRLLAHEPERLTELTYEELIVRGGTESVEVGQLARHARRSPARRGAAARAYYAHRIMGYGLMTFGVDGATA
jgi:hypothetical protein